MCSVSGKNVWFNPITSRLVVETTLCLCTIGRYCHPSYWACSIEDTLYNPKKRVAMKTLKSSHMSYARNWRVGVLYLTQTGCLKENCNIGIVIEMEI